MSYTKAQTRTLVQQFIDDPNAVRWSAANLDLLSQLVIDELWADLLDMAPWLTSQLDTISVPTSPGYIDLRLTPTGALSQRIYRLQKVTRDNYEYGSFDPKNVTLEANTVKAINVPDKTFAVLGDQLHLFPYETTSVEVRYSFRGAAFNGLGESTAVLWPEGHEGAYLHSIAARALSKGDAEDISTQAALADAAMARLRSAIQRRQIGPLAPFAGDTPQYWGGE